MATFEGTWQVRRDTAANWTSANPILAAGEIGFETNTFKIKLGNGSLAWNSLAYIGSLELAAHAAATPNVHGIADTSLLLDQGDIGTLVQGWTQALEDTEEAFTTAYKADLDGLGTLASQNTVTTKLEKIITYPGTLVVGSGATPIPFKRNATITNVYVAVGTAPTGASIIFDVNKNGTTIFSTQGNRPTIAVSTTSDMTSTPNTTSVSAGDILTVDIDQIGSGTPGSNATIWIEYTETIS
jgi:hypothetical protein